ncbi:hypothetical protein H6G04_30005 [Calothrix membranacea FACHB-236]|nr:hypothetical protein [Calothrix membranacea FACHB-236]
MKASKLPQTKRPNFILAFFFAGFTIAALGVAFPQAFHVEGAPDSARAQTQTQSEN